MRDTSDNIAYKCYTEENTTLNLIICTGHRDD